MSKTSPEKKGAPSASGPRTLLAVLFIVCLVATPFLPMLEPPPAEEELPPASASDLLRFPARRRATSRTSRAPSAWSAPTSSRWYHSRAWSTATRPRST